MNETLKRHFAQQLLAEEERILALTERLSAGDESVRREIEVLEQTIQVKIAFLCEVEK